MPTETKDIRMVYHVTYDEGREDWRVLKEGNTNAESHHPTKEEAIEGGNKIEMRAKLGQIIIHKENHVIETEYTYGKDPRSTQVEDCGPGRRPMRTFRSQGSGVPEADIANIVLALASPVPASPDGS